MADEQEVGILGRFVRNLASPFRRRTTPEPQMPLYTTGIQEPVLAQGITIPALYAVAHENLILRTVISKLAQEIFRRGYSNSNALTARRSTPMKWSSAISVVVKSGSQMSIR